MYSKHEVSLKTKLFWTTLGKYMSPIGSAEGEKISWINYKTEIKNISFKMMVENKIATVSITLHHQNINERQLFFKNFEMVKTLLHDAAGDDWIWQLNYVNNSGETCGRIYKQLQNVSILNKDDWPALISFFKHNMIALDRFWSDAKYLFQTVEFGDQSDLDYEN